MMKMVPYLTLSWLPLLSYSSHYMMTIPHLILSCLFLLSPSSH